MDIPKNYAYELDEIDLKIIKLLQEKKKGIITGFSAKIYPLALGFYTKAFISVEVEPSR